MELFTVSSDVKVPRHRSREAFSLASQVFPFASVRCSNWMVMGHSGEEVAMNFAGTNYGLETKKLHPAIGLSVPKPKNAESPESEPESDQR